MDVTVPNAPVEAVAKRVAGRWERSKGRRVRMVRRGTRTAVRTTRVRRLGWMMTEMPREKRALKRGLGYDM